MTWKMAVAQQLASALSYLVRGPEGQLSCRKWDTDEARNSDMVTHTCQHSTQELRREDLEFSYSQLYNEFGNSLGYTIPCCVKMGSGAVAKLLEHLPSMDKA